jgi:hypothetical protein
MTHEENAVEAEIVEEPQQLEGTEDARAIPKIPLLKVPKVFVLKKAT